MSTTRETDLFVHLTGVEAEDTEGFAFMSGLSEAGRLRRAAQALAEEAFLLGAFVDEAEAPEAAALLAAEDGAPAAAAAGARYGAGRLRVWLRPVEGGFEAIQEAGPGGVSLETLTGLVPLQRDRPQRVAGLDALPDQLAALDRRGQRVLLERMQPS